jgi:hypothetical protein
MADLTEQQLLSTDPDVLGLQRQRKLAELLTGQAFNAPQGQMISGRYVAPSNLQQALPMISAAIGGLSNANLDTKQTELAAALRGKQQEAMSRLHKILQPKCTHNKLAQCLMVAIFHNKYKHLLLALIMVKCLKLVQANMLLHNYKLLLTNCLSHLQPKKMKLLHSVI